MFHTISTESSHFPVSAHMPTCLSPLFTCLSPCQPYTHLSQPFSCLSPSRSACPSASALSSPWCTYPILISACSSSLCPPPHAHTCLPVILHLPFSVGWSTRPRLHVWVPLIPVCWYAVHLFLPHPSPACTHTYLNLNLTYSIYVNLRYFTLVLGNPLLAVFMHPPPIAPSPLLSRLPLCC